MPINPHFAHKPIFSVSKQENKGLKFKVNGQSVLVDYGVFTLDKRKHIVNALVVYAAAVI